MIAFSYLQNYGIPVWEALLLLAGGILLLLLQRRRHARRLNALSAANEQLTGLLAKAERLAQAAEARVQALQEEIAEVRNVTDPARLKALQDDLQTAIAHEFVRGLGSILQKSTETAEALKAFDGDSDPSILHHKQQSIITQCYGLRQHARNIVELFALESQPAERERVDMVSPHEVIQTLMAQELLHYAEAKGVQLRLDGIKPEPLLLNRDYLTHICSNIIHNAIKASAAVAL